MNVTIVIPTVGGSRLRFLCNTLQSLRSVSWVQVLVSLAIANTTLPCSVPPNALILDMHARNDEVYTLHRFEAAERANSQWILHTDDDVYIKPAFMRKWMSNVSFSLLHTLAHGLSSQVRFCDRNGYNMNASAAIALTNALLIPAWLNARFVQWFHTSPLSRHVVRQRGNGEDILFSKFLSLQNGSYTFFGACHGVMEPWLCNHQVEAEACIKKSVGFHNRGDHYQQRGNLCTLFYGDSPCDNCFRPSAHVARRRSSSLVGVYVGIPSNDIGLLKRCLDSFHEQNYAGKQAVVFLDGYDTAAYRHLTEWHVHAMGSPVRRGPAHARYRIMQYVQPRANPMDFVLFIDGDDLFVSAQSLVIMMAHVEGRTWVASARHIGPRSYECQNVDPTWSGIDFRANSWRYCHPRMFRVFMIELFRASDFMMDDVWLQKGTDRPLMYKVLEAAGAKHYTFVNTSVIQYTDSPKATLKTLPTAYIHRAKSWVQRVPPVAPFVPSWHILLDFTSQSDLDSLCGRIMPNHKHVHLHIITPHDSPSVHKFTHTIDYYHYRRLSANPAVRRGLLYYISTRYAASSYLWIKNVRSFLQMYRSIAVRLHDDGLVRTGAVTKVFEVHSYDSMVRRRQGGANYIILNESVIEFEGVKGMETTSSSTEV